MSRAGLTQALEWGIGPRVMRRVPDDWAPRGYARLRLEPCGEVIGAEVRGIDLADALDDESIADIRHALCEWKVKTLYVNAYFTDRIVGLDRDESDALLNRLYQAAMHPTWQVRLRWEPGTVAFWDNRATQHYACSDYYPRRRVMDRVAIKGDRPF